MEPGKKSAGISEDPAASITTGNIHRPSALMMGAAGYSAMSPTTHLTGYTASHPRIQCCSNLNHPDPSGHTKPRSHNEVSTLPQYKESCWDPEISLLCQGVIVPPAVLNVIVPPAVLNVIVPPVVLNTCNWTASIFQVSIYLSHNV